MKRTKWKRYVYVRDVQGNIRAVVGENNAVAEQTDYYPYGMPMADVNSSSAQPFKFGGKELEREGGMDFYDFEARRLDFAIGRFTSPDPLCEQTPEISPYAYCAADPVNFIDPTGGWNVRVSASSDRGKHPYATFTAYDRNDNIIFSTIVKVRGDGRIRSETNHDTPQGIYKILEWRETGNDRYSAVKYGPNDLLALDYQSGEGKGRNYMHVHGGRDQGPELTDTWGCLRMADQDIKELKQVVDFVESSDPNESPGYLTVKDDIPAPVSFSDRDDMKFSIFRHVRLDEVICIGQKLPMPESRRPSIVDIVKPVTNPSIK